MLLKANWRAAPCRRVVPIGRQNKLFGKNCRLPKSSSGSAPKHQQPLRLRSTARGRVLPLAMVLQKGKRASFSVPRRGNSLLMEKSSSRPQPIPPGLRSFCVQAAWSWKRAVISRTVLSLPVSLAFRPLPIYQEFLKPFLMASKFASMAPVARYISSIDNSDLLKHPGIFIHLFEQQSLNEPATAAAALIVTVIRSTGWLSFHTCPQTPCDHPKYPGVQSILNNAFSNCNLNHDDTNHIFSGIGEDFVPVHDLWTSV